jgi:hypothetical protein
VSSAAVESTEGEISGRVAADGRLHLMREIDLILYKGESFSSTCHFVGRDPPGGVVWGWGYSVNTNMRRER